MIIAEGKPFREVCDPDIPLLGKNPFTYQKRSEQTKRVTMETWKQEAIKAISALPENVGLEEIMYKLYVIDKVKKGENAVNGSKTITSEELKKEMESW